MANAAVFGVVTLIVFWVIAGLILWGAVATGQAFWAMEGVVAKIAGVLIPLMFIVPFAVTFFFAGLGGVGVSILSDS